MDTGTNVSRKLCQKHVLNPHCINNVYKEPTFVKILIVVVENFRWEEVWRHVPVNTEESVLHSCCSYIYICN